MRWSDIREAYPNEWLILEVLSSHTETSVIVPDRLAVTESCTDASKIMERYTALRHEFPDRFLCFAHTSRETIEFEELFWAGAQLASEA